MKRRISGNFFDNHNTRRTGNFNPERRYLDTPPSRDFDRREPRRCYKCHSLDHFSFNCPKAMKEIKREQPNHQAQSCSATPQKGLHLKSIMLGNEIVSSLIDTGSTVSLIREDVSSKIVDHSRLSKINTVLYGLVQTEVITKGSFEYDFVLDKDHYSLTWHVVSTKQLNFEAVIGTDILGQASLNFTQEDVMFHKHEGNACLMKISGVNPEDELDFSHILDSQVKNDLIRITSSYNPEKTESTDVMRRIILNDDIPVCQPARRLSYAEKKSVSKHIEEGLEQEIVIPSSSEYTSPIVLANKKTYNKKRKKAPGYQVGDLVAVQRTQFGGGLKLRPKFFGPYQITEVKPRDRYTVEKHIANPWVSPLGVSIKVEYVTPTYVTLYLAPLLFGRSQDNYSTIGPSPPLVVDLESGDWCGNCDGHLTVCWIKEGKRLTFLERKRRGAPSGILSRSKLLDR
ncbi:transposon Tf2-6 polyprotein [Trichonephila clavipes]|nr:transposon Tf2-6 polyprotein [Trichonephila clavipes]